MTARALVLVAATAMSALGCGGAAPKAATPAAAPVPRPEPATNTPPLVVGRFTDDYGSMHVISSDEWVHDGRSRYHITRWVAAKEYLIAYNDVANPSDGGKWTRIDWLALPGMPPWEWAFCLSAYQAPTAAAAEAVTTANRAMPRTGCNGFPFTRMKRVAGAPPDSR